LSCHLGFLRLSRPPKLNSSLSCGIIPAGDFYLLPAPLWLNNTPGSRTKNPKTGDTPMTTATGEILVKEILPILGRTVPRVVNPSDCEDSEELIADTLATAAEMLQSLEKAGRKIPARSVAFYSIQRAKSGRRAYQSGASDPLSPVFRTRNTSAIVPIDAPLSSEGEGSRTMSDFIVAATEDPSETALRRID